MAESVHQKTDYLNKLDAEAGDGDHGTNLDRGFAEVNSRIVHFQDREDIGVILEETGSILISSVGGASGPLFGTAFKRAGKASKGKSSIDLKDMTRMFEAAEQGIASLGDARVGDKTMLDSLDPATEAARKAIENGEIHLLPAFESIVSSAEVGLENTKTLVAKKGRAMYLGERALGSYDVGAASFCIMLRSVLETLREIDQKSGQT